MGEYPYNIYLVDANAPHIVSGDIWRSPMEERERENLIQSSPKLHATFTWHRKLWKRTIPYKIRGTLGSKGKIVVDLRDRRKLVSCISSCISRKPIVYSRIHVAHDERYFLQHLFSESFQTKSLSRIFSSNSKDLLPYALLI